MLPSDVPPSLDEFLASPPAEVRPASIDGLRLEAIRERGLTYGVQGGLARRAHEIRVMLDGRAVELDRVFDFSRMLLESNVLPPVLSEGGRQLRVDDPNTIRLVDQTFTIESQARFVTAAPTWRDYLMTSLSFPVPNAQSFLVPRTADERQAWVGVVREGWGVGVAQADAIFDANLARLKRDFDGMVLYRKLLAQNMVTKPFVAQSDLGVTGDGRRVAIGERVLRITVHPSLRIDSTRWRPVAVPVGPAPLPASAPSAPSAAGPRPVAVPDDGGVF